MEVEVIRLRREGVRISIEELRRTPPVRGSLTVMSRLGHGSREQVITATLVCDKTWPAVLPVLDHMRLTRLRGDQFILMGFEEVDLRRRQVGVFPQSWWCRIVRDPQARDRFHMPIVALDELEEA